MAVPPLDFTFCVVIPKSKHSSSTFSAIEKPEKRQSLALSAFAGLVRTPDMPESSGGKGLRLLICK